MAADRAHHARALRAVAAAALGLVATLAAGPARAEDPATLADVLRSLRIDELPMHYVVLVDNSGSMGSDGLYQRAVSATRSLVGGLAPTDRLSLITFNAEPRDYFDGAIADDPGPKLDEMAGEPPAGSTDIGKAMAETLTVLGASGTDPAAVVVLTDLKEQPPEDSPYADPDSAAWTTLQRGFAEMSKRRQLRVYPVPLLTAHDADAVTRIFPGEDIVRMNLEPAQFQRYLGTLRDTAKVDKAREYLRGDLTQIDARVVDAPRIPREGATLKVELTSRSTYLPLTVSHLGIAVDSLPLAAGPAPPPVTLQPGESTTVRLVVDNHGSRRALGDDPVESGRLTVTGTVDSPWGQVLNRDLGLTPPMVLTGGRVDVRAVTGDGVAYTSIFLPLIVLVLALVGWRAAVRARRAALSGQLTIVEPGRAKPATVQLSGRRMRLPRGGEIGLAGRCTATGRAGPKRDGRAREVMVHVRYSGAGASGRRTLRAGETREIGKTTFTYRPGR